MTTQQPIQNNSKVLEDETKTQADPKLAALLLKYPHLAFPRVVEQVKEQVRILFEGTEGSRSLQREATLKLITYLETLNPDGIMFEGYTCGKRWHIKVSERIWQLKREVQP